MSCGAVVLVDEPELSLHPTWQAGILPFYDSIVTQTAEKRSQVIVATHSPFVVHGSPTAKHVILRRDQGTGRISVDAAPAYPGVTSADVAVAAFDLEELGIGVPTKPIVMIVEGPTDRAILDVAWTKLYPGCEQPFVFHSAGNARAVQQLLGSSEIGKAGPVLDAASSTGTLGAIGLFDFDGEGFGHWNGTIKLEHAEEVSEDSSWVYRKRRGAFVWAALLPVLSFRAGYAGLGPGLKSRSVLTIELLFPDDFVAPLLETVPVPGAPAAWVLRARTEAQKRAVAAAAADFPTESFEAFRPIFELAARSRLHSIQPRRRYREP